MLCSLATYGYIIPEEKEEGETTGPLSYSTYGLKFKFSAVGTETLESFCLLILMVFQDVAKHPPTKLSANWSCMLKASFCYKTCKLKEYFHIDYRLFPLCTENEIFVYQRNIYSHLILVATITHSSSCYFLFCILVFHYRVEVIA